MDKLVFNCIISIFKPSLSYLSHIFICGDKIISVVCFKNQYFMSVKRLLSIHLLFFLPLMRKNAKDEPFEFKSQNL